MIEPVTPPIVTPAPPAPTETPGRTVPLSDLLEERKKRQDAEARATTLEKESQDRLTAQLVEQGKYKDLADQRAEKLAELQPKADQVESYEKTLLGVLTAQVESLPEDKRGLVPEALSTQQKLDWLSKNAAILKAPAAFDIGAGRHGGDEDKKKIELTPEEIQTAKQFGVTPEDYQKFK